MTWHALLALWSAIGWHYHAVSERPDQLFVLDAIAELHYIVRANNIAFHGA